MKIAIDPKVLKFDKKSFMWELVVSFGEVYIYDVYSLQDRDFQVIKSGH